MPTWKLNTEFKFDTAHFIEGYDGKCGRMHGHSYRIRITAVSNKLNPSKYLGSADMVCDFRALKWASKDAEEGGLAHSVLKKSYPELRRQNGLPNISTKRPVIEFPII